MSYSPYAPQAGEFIADEGGVVTVASGGHSYVPLTSVNNPVPDWCHISGGHLLVFDVSGLFELKAEIDPDFSNTTGSRAWEYDLPDWSVIRSADAASVALAGFTGEYQVFHADAEGQVDVQLYQDSGSPLDFTVVAFRVRPLLLG